MYQVQLNQPVHIHFIGIGGISMSGLAEILLDRGFTVTGSDMHESALTKHLEKKGATIFFPQAKENVVDGIDVVVYTAAIHEDNPEYLEVKRQGLPMLTRAELLGELMRNYKEAINIAGTHGKTTTTSMVSEILLEAGVDPTITIGGVLDDIGGNVHAGKQDYIVVEACEYTNSFLSFYPTVSVLLNVEADHLDFFKDLDDVRHSFREFARKTSKDGAVVINQDIDHYEYFIEGLSQKVITFGNDGTADYYAKNIRFDELACGTFDVYEKGNLLGEVTLCVPGNHNISNALAAIATCRYFDIPFNVIADGLKRYRGTERRFEYKGVVNGFTIIDDYAHHPQEIDASIQTALAYPHKKLWVAFQSHTYTRTAALLDEFAESLSKADVVIVADIYAAREENTIGISGQDIVDKIKQYNENAFYIPTFKEIEDYAIKNVQEGDLFVTMGAGDINLVGEHLIEEYGEKQ